MLNCVEVYPLVDMTNIIFIQNSIGICSRVFVNNHDLCGALMKFSSGSGVSLEN